MVLIVKFARVLKQTSGLIQQSTHSLQNIRQFSLTTIINAGEIKKKSLPIGYLCNNKCTVKIPQKTTADFTKLLKL